MATDTPLTDPAMERRRQACLKQLADIDGSTSLESVFGGTVGAASRRAKAGKSFVGTFHSKMEGSAVAKTLTKAILSRHRLIKAQK